MESGIIDQPPTEKNTNGNDIDRISELPDCILHHILSFLETKCTVQTSILSKRWRHIWASVPALDLTDDSFIRNAFWWSNDSYKRNFENFVDTVLLLRDASDLRSFSLRCYKYFDAGHVHRWIHYATKYNPKVVQIKLAQWYCFPLEILPCQFLEELSMNLHFIVQHGPPKIMGCLRRLHIQSVNYKHGFMENLISSCPVLEDLDLYNCVFDALCISSNTLKRLRMESCIFGLSENLISSCPVLEDLDFYNCAFDALCISSNTLKRLCIDSCVFGLSGNLISAPSLICLTYTDNSASTTLKNLSSLLNATVHIIRGDAFEITRGLANVETLNFSFSEAYQCKLPEDLFPIFDNLRTLRFAGKCTSYMIQVIAFFLQRSPNLKTFYLKNMGVSPLSLWRWKVIQKSSKLSFKCPHLQLIQIHCSRREWKLRELIKYLPELIKYLRLNATGEPKVVIIWDWKYF